MRGAARRRSVTKEKSRRPSAPRRAASVAPIECRYALRTPSEFIPTGCTVPHGTCPAPRTRTRPRGATPTRRTDSSTRLRARRARQLRARRASAEVGMGAWAAAGCSLALSGGRRHRTRRQGREHGSARLGDASLAPGGGLTEGWVRAAHLARCLSSACRLTRTGRSRGRSHSSMRVS